jgi:hypothetical protein
MDPTRAATGVKMPRTVPQARRTDTNSEQSSLTPINVGWLDRHPNPLVFIGLALASSLMVGAAVAIKPKVAILLIVAVAVGLAVLRRPAFGGYLLVGVVPITSGLRSGFPVPGFRLSELLIGTVSIAILLTASSRQSIRWRTFDWLLLTYAATAATIGFYSMHVDRVSLSGNLIGTLFGPMQFLLLYRAIAVSLPLRRQRNVALRLLLIASMPVSFIALLQQLKVGGINEFVTNITGSTVFSGYGYSLFVRATGPFDHWTPLAGYLLVILVLGISLVLHGVEGVLSRRATFLILGFDALGLLLSVELSAIVALVICGVALGVWSGKLKFLLRWGLLLGIVLAALFGGYLSQRLSNEYIYAAGTPHNPLVPQTVQFRFTVWAQQYFPAIRQQLWHGYGPVFPNSIVWQYTESQYVTYLMWGGIPLMLAFLAMMWALFSRARFLARPGGGPPARWAVARAVAVLVVSTYLIDSIYPYMTSAGLPQALFAVVGVMVAAERGALSGDRSPNQRSCGLSGRSLTDEPVPLPAR